MSDTLWLRSEDWVGTEVDGSFVMVNVETGKYISLNESATAIWHALETPRHEGEIAAYLSERFDITPADCGAAVAATLAEMQGLALLAKPA